MHRHWKKGQVLWAAYRDATRLYRKGIRKAKAQLELGLARNAKNDKKVIYRYINCQRKVQKGIPHLVSNTGRLITTDREKADVLINLFTSVFTGNFSAQSP